jgi:hypothetical protein
MNEAFVLSIIAAVAAFIYLAFIIYWDSGINICLKVYLCEIFSLVLGGFLTIIFL